MEIRKYEAFLKSVELGSFTAAAEELKYTTAGIGHMVESIEAELGFPLLKRSRSGVSLTRYGEELIEEIRRLVQDGNRLMAHADSLKGLMTGTLVVGAYYSIASHWLPPVFKSYTRRYPQISIQLLEGGHQLLNQWMSEGRLDLMLTSYDPSLSWEWIPLRTDPMVVVLPEGHSLAGKSSLRLADCADQQLIMPANGQDFDVLQALQAENADLNIRFTTVENYSALAMVEQGLGISIMNNLITLRQDYHVVKVPLKGAKDIELGIYVPSMSTATPAAREMIDALLRFRDEASETPPVSAS